MDEAKDRVPMLTVIEDGGVASAVGFKAGGIHAGFRKNPERCDLALVEADEVCAAAGVFTRNEFCAAPVAVSREHLGPDASGSARAIVVNSGIANAATGFIGVENARASALIAADAVGCAPEDVLVASTGVIGVHLPVAPFEKLEELHRTLELGNQGHDAALAIMTTDTVPKEAAVSYESADPAFAGMRVTLGGMAKGSGMIMPDMATMISVIATDAPVGHRALKTALKRAVDFSFNKVTVDSDTSTNDTCFLLASGKAPGAPEGRLIEEGTVAYGEFCGALSSVATTLAKRIAADGEGATRLITVRVRGAFNEADADAAARSVANSPLVKTAVFGHDANWGRIAMALGKSGASFNQEDVDIDIMGLAVCRRGLTVDFDEEEALERFENPEILIECDLHAGTSDATVWTCDLTHEYITINGDYRT